jgi:hypothetical protein
MIGLSRLLRSMKDLAEMYPAIAEHAMKLLRTDHGSLALIDAKRETLTCFYSRGNPDEKPGTPFSLSRSHAAPPRHRRANTTDGRTDAGRREIVRHHQERWDGSGYSDGLRGDGIPLGARILAVVDAYSAMTEARPYKPLGAPGAAIEEILRCAGTQFDPRVAEAFRTVARRLGLA